MSTYFAPAAVCYLITAKQSDLLRFYKIRRLPTGWKAAKKADAFASALNSYFVIPLSHCVELFSKSRFLVCGGVFLQYALRNRSVDSGAHGREHFGRGCFVARGNRRKEFLYFGLNLRFDYSVLCGLFFDYQRTLFC